MRALFAACTAALSGALVLAMTGIAVGDGTAGPGLAARLVTGPAVPTPAVPTTPSVPAATAPPAGIPQAAPTAPIRPGR